MAVVFLGSIRRPLPLLLLAACLAAAAISISAKLWLTRGEVMPGLDGAYYWVQVRAILTRGGLAFPDLPLILWVQAGLAGIIGDIPLAVRISDAVLPALSVIPLAILAKNGQPRWMIPVVLLAVVVHPVQLFFFTGDFIKNESTIPLVFVLGLLLARWRSDRRWAFIAGILAVLGLIALCHFGTLLLSLTMTLIWALAKTGRRSWRFWLLTAASVISGLAVILVLLYSLVPDRFERLVALVGDPTALVHNAIWRDIQVGYFRPAILFAIISGQVMAVVLGILAWRARKQLAPTVKAALVAFLITAFIGSSPLISADWADRLIALSFVPLWLAGILLWVSIPGKTATISVTTLTATALLGTALVTPIGWWPGVLDGKRLQDFTAISEALKLDRPSLVVASHGLDFLAAWQLRTDVSDDRFFNLANEGIPYQSVYRINRAYEVAPGEVVYSNDSFVVTRLK